MEPRHTPPYGLHHATYHLTYKDWAHSFQLSVEKEKAKEQPNSIVRSDKNSFYPQSKPLTKQYDEAFQNG